MFFISFSLYAQDSEQKKLGSIGLTYSSFGQNTIVRDEIRYGDVTFKDVKFYTLGIAYVRPINAWLEFETGMEYSKHTISIRPIYYLAVHEEDLSLINIPLTLRANFLKFFFVNGGAFIDFNTNDYNPIDSQPGIGGLLGIATKYDFKCGASIFINPYLKFHSLIPFSPEKYQQKINESGIRLGLTYNLNRIK
jgi:hypothetical protein